MSQKATCRIMRHVGKSDICRKKRHIALPGVRVALYNGLPRSTANCTLNVHWVYTDVHRMYIVHLMHIRNSHNRIIYYATMTQKRANTKALQTGAKQRIIAKCLQRKHIYNATQINIYCL